MNEIRRKSEPEKVSVVRRDALAPVEADLQTLQVSLMSQMLEASFAGPGNIVLRQAGGIKNYGMTLDSERRIRIALHDGFVNVNGRKVSIPPGLSGSMTGKEFKRFAGIYSGDALYVGREDGMQRIRDTEVVEVAPDAVFKHNRIVAVPRYSRD